MRHGRVARDKSASEWINEHLNHFVAAGLTEHVDVAGCAHQSEGLSVLVGVKTTSARWHSSTYNNGPCSNWNLTQPLERVNGRRHVPDGTKIACGLLLQRC
jgi:hypothetical protein